MMCNLSKQLIFFAPVGKLLLDLSTSNRGGLTVASCPLPPLLTSYPHWHSRLDQGKVDLLPIKVNNSKKQTEINTPFPRPTPFFQDPTDPLRYQLLTPALRGAGEWRFLLEASTPQPMEDPTGGSTSPPPPPTSAFAGLFLTRFLLPAFFPFSYLRFPKAPPSGLRGWAAPACGAAGTGLRQPRPLLTETPQPRGTQDSND